MRWTDRCWTVALALVIGLCPVLGRAQAITPPAPASAETRPSGATSPAAPRPLQALGPGDEVRMRVFGQPNMNGTLDVSDNGTISVPLAGRVHVGGLSPSQAAHKVEAALKRGQFLVDPHVTLTMVKSLSERVAVLGQVRTPGIYSIDSSTTLIDLLAQAGGETKAGANTVYILRTSSGGEIRRLAVNLQGLADAGTAPEAAVVTMRGGDQVYVPRAPMFYVTGQVHTPGRFRLGPGVTVLQAVARAGGVTNMGSMSRIVIKRREPNGRYRIISAQLTDRVQRNDVITVKERIF